MAPKQPHPLLVPLLEKHGSLDLAQKISEDRGWVFEIWTEKDRLADALK